MKTIQLTGLHDLEMQERPDPVMRGAQDVLLRIEVVGVCGSDIHYYATGRIGSQVVQVPFPVGHECSATVVKVGCEVTHLAPGDRVAVDPAVSCGECDQCLAGRRHTCRELTFMGCPGQMDGCLGDFYVMPAESVYKIPDEMTMEQAALIEPLSIAYYAVKLSQMQPGMRIGILGAGPIGLCVMVAARHAGAEHIYMTDPIEARREVAAANGASFVCDPFEDGIGAIVEQEPDRLDMVFECCGEQAAVDQALRLLKAGGKLMLIGIPEVDRLSFEMDIMRRHELCVQNVRRQNECVQAAIDMVMDDGVEIDFMITHRFDFAETKAAFDLVDGYADGVVKAMIRV